jgi:hypothetical protein
MFMCDIGLNAFKIFVADVIIKVNQQLWYNEQERNNLIV